MLNRISSIHSMTGHPCHTECDITVCVAGCILRYWVTSGCWVHPESMTRYCEHSRLTRKCVLPIWYDNDCPPSPAHPCDCELLPGVIPSTQIAQCATFRWMQLQKFGSLHRSAYRKPASWGFSGSNFFFRAKSFFFAERSTKKIFNPKDRGNISENRSQKVIDDGWSEVSMRSVVQVCASYIVNQVSYHDLVEVVKISQSQQLWEITTQSRYRVSSIWSFVQVSVNNMKHSVHNRAVQELVQREAKSYYWHAHCTDCWQYHRHTTTTGNRADMTIKVLKARECVVHVWAAKESIAFWESQATTRWAGTWFCHKHAKHWLTRQRACQIVHHMSRSKILYMHTSVQAR